MTYFESLNGENGGLVLNVSETGLLLQFALKVNDGEVSRLRFRLSQSDDWIEARAKLIWISKSGKEAGAQFLELPEDARVRIEEWLANGRVPTTPVGIPRERIVSQPTSMEPPSPAPVPSTHAAHVVTDPDSVFMHSDTGRPLDSRPCPDRAGTPAVSTTPPGSVQQDGDLPPASFAQTRPETKLPWWGLRRVLSWVALVVVVLVGLRYSPQLRRLPMLGRVKEVLNILVVSGKSVLSPSTKAVISSAAGPAEAQASGTPANPSERRTASASSMDAHSVSSPFAPKDAGSNLGSMVTQTLSPGSTSTESNGTSSQTKRRRTRLQSSEARFQPYRDAPEPTSDTALIGAPPVGAPPARVFLETEPVSASSMVAVTARRSLLVPGSHEPTEKLQLGKLVSYVDPIYPERALASEVEGTVTVRAFIGRSGEVLSVRLLGGPAILAPAAIRAIREWRYDPTLLNGQAVESQADVSVFFRLH